MENCLPSAAEWDIIIGGQKGSGEAMDSVGAEVDREKVIQEVIAMLAILEKCSYEGTENVKRLLRWLPDDALMGIRDKHREVLGKAAEKRLSLSPARASASRRQCHQTQRHRIEHILVIPFLPCPVLGEVDF